MFRMDCEWTFNIPNKRSVSRRMMIGRRDEPPFIWLFIRLFVRLFVRLFIRLFSGEHETTLAIEWYFQTAQKSSDFLGSHCSGS